MPQQYLVPGEGFANDTTTSQVFVPGFGFANNSSAAVFNGTASGNVDTVILSSPSAQARIGLSVSIDPVALAAPSTTAAISDTGITSIDAISLTAPSGSASVTINRTASGAIDSIGATAPNALAGIGDSGGASVDSISLSAPNGSASTGKTVTGDVDSIGTTAPSGIASVSVSGSGLVDAISLTIPSATASASDSGNGNIDAINLIAPSGNAQTGNSQTASGLIDNLSLTAPIGAASISGTGTGSIAQVNLSAATATAASNSSANASGSIDSITLLAPNGIGGTDVKVVSGNVEAIDISPVIANVTKNNPTHKTIIWQYQNSPIINQIVNDFQGSLDRDVLTHNFISLIWDVRTANSYGLDILGRIVGIGRYLSLTDNSYFGFEPDFSPFNQFPFFHGSAVTNQFRLGDDQYRKVILAKAANNISSGSIPAIENVLKLLFGDKGKSSVRVDGHLLISYLFYWTPEPIDLAIIQTPNLLPQPVGHRITKSFV